MKLFFLLSIQDLIFIFRAANSIGLILLTDFCKQNFIGKQLPFFSYKQTEKCLLFVAVSTLQRLSSYNRERMACRAEKISCFILHITCLPNS